MPAVTPDAIYRKVAGKRPSVLRWRPLLGKPRPFGARSQKVIALLRKGLADREVARRLDMRRENVRITRLRAERRGLLQPRA